MSEAVHRSKHQQKKERRLQKVCYYIFLILNLHFKQKGKRNSRNVKRGVQSFTEEQKNKATAVTSKVTDNDYIV